MRNWIKPLLVGLLGAIIGTLIVLNVVHLYQDHHALHAVITFVQQHADKIARLP